MELGKRELRTVLAYGVQKRVAKKTEKALIPRKKQFADKMLSGECVSATQAAREVGVPDNIAGQTAHRWMQKDLGVRSYMFREMEKVGITDPYIAMKMKEGMAAMTKPVKEGGEMYDDYFVRKQYIDMYFRLKGMYAPEKSEHTEKVIVLNMTPQMVQGLVDSEAITADDALILEAEIIEEEENNAER